MSPHYWISVIGIAEANSPRRVRRQRFRFAAWCGRKVYQRYSMLPMFLIPPLALLLAFQSAPDFPKWLDWGGFAALSLYMVYRYEKLVKDVQDRAAVREQVLIDTIKEDLKVKGQLVDAVTALISSKACPYTDEHRPPERRGW